MVELGAVMHEVLHAIQMALGRCDAECGATVVVVVIHLPAQDVQSLHEKLVALVRGEEKSKLIVAHVECV